jgi:predicted NUDIX family phosphoesterase
MKKALCIPTDSIISTEVIKSENKNTILSNPSIIFSKKTFLLDRKDCETDESFLQIIPYVTLVDKDTGDVFSYRRGKGGNEARLMQEHSIGLGGHIEEEPNETTSLLEVIVRGTMLELNEEVGLNEKDYLDKIHDNYKTGNFGCIHCRDSEVGRVHIGLCMFLIIDKKHITALEKDIITNGQWLSLSNLYKLTDAKEMNLESWSKLVLDIIKSESK